MQKHEHGTRRTTSLDANGNILLVGSRHSGWAHFVAHYLGVTSQDSAGPHVPVRLAIGSEVGKENNRWQDGEPPLAFRFVGWKLTSLTRQDSE